MPGALGLLGFVARRRMRQEAKSHLDELRIRIPKLWGTPVESLSGGQRQSVAIARAVVWASKLMIMDEPTAALGVAQSEAVLALVRRVREKGTSVIIISHILPHVIELADRVLVMRHGRPRRCARSVGGLAGSPDLTDRRLRREEHVISPEGDRRIVRAGAAAVRLSPPPGLPMIGFVRRQEPARGEGIPLEASAIAIESAGMRIVLCGVDTIGIQSPEVDELRARVSEATGAPIQGVLLNWNHTHCAPPGSTTLVEGGGLLADGVDEPLRAHVHALHDAVVAVCARAAERLEPAALTWGVGTADL